MGERNSFIRPILYLLPAIIIIAVFRFLPILYVTRVSLYKWGMGGAERFTGLGNYLRAFSDLYFWQSLTNTMWYVIFVVPLTIFFSLLVALFLNSKIKALGFYRTTYFLPVVTSIVAVSMIWKWIYHPRIGLANYILSVFHLPLQRWLSEWRGVFEIMTGRDLPNVIAGPSLALLSIIIMMVWKSIGYNMIIFLAGLQNIPRHYYEAAEVDGANRLTVFKNITWPLLSSTTFYVLIMTTIVSFQVFAPIWLMTGPPAGGPLGTTNVLVYYLFDVAFNYSSYGYASALSMILFLMILSLTVLQKRVVERRVYYE